MTQNHHQTLYNTTTSAVHTRVAFAPKGHSGASLSLCAHGRPSLKLYPTRFIRLHTHTTYIHFLFFSFLLLPKNKKNLDGSLLHRLRWRGEKHRQLIGHMIFEYIKKKKGTFCVWMAATWPYHKIIIIKRSAIIKRDWHLPFKADITRLSFCRWTKQTNNKHDLSTDKFLAWPKEDTTNPPPEETNRTRNPKSKKKFFSFATAFRYLHLFLIFRIVIVCCRGGNRRK